MTGQSPESNCITMRIGELAKASGTPTETIRFYEREGLLAAPARTDSNYRDYGAEHVERLTFIRHCRTLDMALDEIRTLLRFKAAPRDNCAGVNELLDDHIGHVAARIRELKALEKQLKALREACPQAQSAGECGILNALSDNGVQGPVRRGRKHVPGTHA